MGVFLLMKGRFLGKARDEVSLISHMGCVKLKILRKGRTVVKLDLVTYGNVLQAIARYILPVLSLFLLLRCGRQLCKPMQQRQVLAWLRADQRDQIPVCYWENVVGSDKHSDIYLTEPGILRRHGVLKRHLDGSWSLQSLDTHWKIRALEAQDRLTIGEGEWAFCPVQVELTPGNELHPIGIVFLLSVAQLLLGGVCALCGPGQPQDALVGFGGLMVLQWVLLLLQVCAGRPWFTAQTLAFYLCSLGMAVILSVRPQEAGKQLLAMVFGVAVYLTVSWSLRSQRWLPTIGHVAAVAAPLLLLVTLVFGTRLYGAKNWIFVGGISLQPSELAKVCFVYVGASTLDRLVRMRHQILLMVYTLALCGLLVLMNDLGTALVFFCTFLIVAYLRSGSLGTLALAVTAALFAGVVGLQLAGHAQVRLQTWRHIWSDPYGAGYQQTQALMGIASGGILGLGMGRGSLRQLFAADSDMVFATLSQEWGLIIAMLGVLCIALLALAALRHCRGCRSSFHAIASCTAASIFLVQTVFNVLGIVDILPLTGVTFPFLSNGGSSMIASWALLAFLQNTQEGL